MAKTEQYTTEQMEDALHKTKGAVTLAAQYLGCSYNTVYRYIKKYKSLGKVVDFYRERRVDVAELKLDQAVERGEPWAIALVLKTLGKHRGYIEKQEQESSGEIAIKIIEGHVREPKQIAPMIIETKSNGG